MALVTLLWTLLRTTESAGTGGPGGTGGTYTPYVGRCMTSFCRDGWVGTRQIGDGVCDWYCMTPFCGWDSEDGIFETSDCKWNCIYTGCETSLLGDRNCDSRTFHSECNTYECGFDMGDCSYCADGCVRVMLGDLKPQAACDNSQCNFDGGDMGWCASGCTQAMTLNSVCDLACLTEECKYDMPACQPVVVNSTCFTVMVGNGQCNSECYIQEANWDGGDCNCAPGCTYEKLHNTLCDVECASAACQWDDHKCVSDI